MIHPQTTHTPAGEPPQHETSRALELGASTGSAPWAWTHDRNMEYWSAGGKTREQAIWEGKRRGRKIFWIAQTRAMTEDETGEMDGSWVIDPTTEEEIMPNVAVSRIGPPTENLSPP